MTDGINLGNLFNKGLEALMGKTKTVSEKVINGVKSVVENTPVKKSAKLFETVRENGLQATAEDIIDDVKTTAETFLENPGKSLAEKIGEATKQSAPILKAGVEAGKAVGEKLGEVFKKD